MRTFAAALLLALAACGDVVIQQPRPIPVPAPAPTPDTVIATPGPRGPTVSARNFARVIDDVMPLAVRECRARTRRVRCDYAVVVDDRPGLPANAFQTLGPGDQPVVGFTLALIREAKNVDELAFILSHEAAHHIEGHIRRGQVNAATGAILAGALATLGGGDAAAIQRAQNAGAFVGGRRFSKEFELEADALGAILALRAGYDPVRGVAFFQGVPDPGNQFLGTHPPNSDRIRLVREVVAANR